MWVGEIYLIDKEKSKKHTSKTIKHTIKNTINQSSNKASIQNKEPTDDLLINTITRTLGKTHNILQTC